MLLTANHFRQLDRRSAHLFIQGTGIILTKIFFATSKLKKIAIESSDAIIFFLMIAWRIDVVAQDTCSEKLRAK